MADSYVVKSGVVLHNFAKHYVDRVANSFQKSTGKILVVTSGYRGPSQQAGEMYKKFQGPEANIYRDKVALAEIREVYERDVTARKSRDETIAGMAAVIESQVRQHRLISKHLSATAVDFRIKGLSRIEIEALEKASRDNGAKKILKEGHSPHLHVQF